MQSRIGNLLDAEWRRSVWKRWLRSRLAAEEDVAPPRPEASISVPSVPRPAPVPTPSSPPGQAPAREADPRRGEVRARFDALFDRLLAVEDTLDALGKRFALRAVHERRHDQRVLERLESTSDTLERQTLALEAVSATMERIEQRVERLERWLRADGGQRELFEPRESRTAPARSAADEFDELERSFASESQSPPRTTGDPAEAWDVPPFSSSSIRGNLAEMSLPTVLAMLELERRTGVLKVSADDGSVVSATLLDGAVVGARHRDLEIDPIDAVREALRLTNGHFWFRQVGVEVASGPARSVGSVLLEATRRNDEALRSA
jgi:hypothetical protein